MQLFICNSCDSYCVGDDEVIDLGLEYWFGQSYSLWHCLTSRRNYVIRSATTAFNRTIIYLINSS
jgi:hypothetical protein